MEITAVTRQRVSTVDMTVGVETGITEVDTRRGFEGVTLVITGIGIVFTVKRVLEVEETIELTPAETGTALQLQIRKVILMRAVAALVSGMRSPVQIVHADVSKSPLIFSLRRKRGGCSDQGCNSRFFHNLLAVYLVVKEYRSQK